MVRFEPQVERPVARIRPVFAIALVATVAFSFGVVVWDVWLRPQPAVLPAEVLPIPAQPAPPRVAPRAASSTAPAGCTSLEVEQTLRVQSLTDAERVTCLAVAGKIDRARELLHAMPGDLRMHAVAHLFNVAHPIADSGDDASAGPIMGLVVEFWPQNYMAVFHAGMSDFALGRDDTAGKQLENFLGMYAAHDVWRARAKQALAAIAEHAPVGRREAHFPE